MSIKESLNATEKLSLIQQQIKVPKGQYNAFGKYHYRSAEDILEAVKPYQEKFNVTFTIDDEIRSIEIMDSPLVYVKAVASMTDNDTKETISCSGNAFIDFEAKGMQMPQRTGSASSYAKKYALGNLLLIDDTKDPDGTNTHGQDSAPSKSGSTTPKPAPKPEKKSMSLADKTKFLKAIGEGKFTQVESYLSRYKDDSVKKAVADALSKAKKG